MLHHISFPVADLERASVFYDAVLFQLGYCRVWTFPDAVGYGKANSGDKFAIKLCSEKIIVPGAGFHIAFAAPGKEPVDKFYSKAIVHGGTDNGKPGFRPDYGKNYYAAFVIDPDGYKIEAVINEWV